jgi:uncharacterized protein (DUF2236 family)
MPPASGDGIKFESISSWAMLLLGISVTVNRSWLMVDEMMGYSSSSGNAVRRRILCDIARFTGRALPLQLRTRSILKSYVHLKLRKVKLMNIKSRNIRNTQRIHKL